MVLERESQQYNKRVEDKYRILNRGKASVDKFIRNLSKDVKGHQSITKLSKQA